MPYNKTLAYEMHYRMLLFYMDNLSSEHFTKQQYKYSEKTSPNILSATNILNIAYSLSISPLDSTSSSPKREGTTATKMTAHTPTARPSTIFKGAYPISKILKYLRHLQRRVSQQREMESESLL